MKRFLKILTVSLLVVSFATLLSSCLGETACKHEFGEWSVTVPSTCAYVGKETRTCSKCSAVEERTIDMLEHTVATRPAKQPTCSEEGLTEGTYCSVCTKAIIKQEPIPTLEHTFTDEVTSPTCTEGGYTVHTCSVCEYSYTDGNTDPLEHDMGEWTTVKEATCTKSGEDKRECSRCSHSEKRTVPALDHDMSEWTTVKKATCTEAGKEERVCSRCSHKEENTLGKVDHSYKATSKVDVTCESDGYTVYTCSSCGSSYNGDLEKAPGHDFENGKCTVCDLLAVNVYVDGIKKSSIPKKGNYVVFALDGDKLVKWDYTNWELISNSETANIYFFSVSKLYSSLDSLRSSSASLSNNSIVGIASYYEGAQRGAAILKISSSGTIALGNGKYATVVPFTVGSESIVTVDQFGAYADGTHADHGAISSAIGFNSATTVYFEGEAYLQTNGISLSNLKNKTVIGYGAYICNDYSSVNWADVTINTCSNITVKGLELRCTETTGKGALFNNNDHVQMLVKNSTNIVFDGITLYTPNNTTNDRHVTSMWIHSGNNNVTVKNSTIKNFSGSSVGGGIWVSGSNNITIINNHLEKSSHDEILAFFLSSCDTALIEGNYIYTHDEPAGDASAHAIGFGVYTDGNILISNMIFRNNVVDVVSYKDAIMFGTVDNIQIYDNDITLRQNTAGQVIQCAVFRVPSPGSTTQKNVKIYNNNISIYSSRNLPLTESCGSGFDIHDNPISKYPFQ